MLVPSSSLERELIPGYSSSLSLISSITFSPCSVATCCSDSPVVTWIVASCPYGSPLRSRAFASRADGRPARGAAPLGKVREEHGG